MHIQDEDHCLSSSTSCSAGGSPSLSVMPYVMSAEGQVFCDTWTCTKVFNASQVPSKLVIPSDLAVFNMGWFSSTPAEQPQEASSLEGTYKPLKRNERKACWEARDAYFGCLDKHQILDAVKDEDAAKSKCPRENDLFEKDCATSWVSLWLSRAPGI